MGYLSVRPHIPVDFGKTLFRFYTKIGGETLIPVRIGLELKLHVKCDYLPPVDLYCNNRFVSEQGPEGSIWT
jgi:hypothetical protein